MEIGSLMLLFTLLPFSFTMGLPVVDADFMGPAFPELQVHMN